MNILNPKMILATAAGVLIGGFIATFIQGIYAAPVHAAVNVNTVSQVKVEPFPVPMTPSQMKEHHGVERFYDAQMGVVCYRMIQKNVMSCLPKAQTYMRHSEAVQQPQAN